MKRLGMLLVVLCALPSTAQAALEPPTAAVSPGTTALFAGTLNTFGQVAFVDVAQGTVGGMHGTCVEPMCQEGTLTVSGGSAGRLHVVVGNVKGVSNLALEVERPDGTTVYVGSGYFSVNKERHAVLDAPADGTYVVRVAGEGSPSNDGIADFQGGAWVEMPGGSSGSGNPVLDEIACPLRRTYAYPLVPSLRDRQWGLDQIKADAGWRRGFTGKGVRIAVIDSGIDAAHPEFAGRLLPGLDGLPDDPTCGPGPADDNGHGTAVASLAAAAADGAGITGVAPEAEIIPIRVGDAEGSVYEDAIIAGVRHAIAQDADVINMSFGGDEKALLLEGVDSRVLIPVMQEAWEKGIVLIAAGGNLNEPLCLYPARAPNVLCVAGTDRNALPSDFSALPNGDAVGNGVRAPAGASETARLNGCVEYILHAAWPARGGNCELGTNLYGMGIGTSYAAPLVSGLAAMLEQAGLSRDEIVQRIRATASNRGASDPVMGYGIVDVDGATAGLTPAPTAQNQRVAAQPVRSVSKRCRAARAASLRATRRAVSARRAFRAHRSAARRRTLKRRLRARDRAVRLVARRC